MEIFQRNKTVIDCMPVRTLLFTIKRSERFISDKSTRSNDRCYMYVRLVCATECLLINFNIYLLPGALIHRAGCKMRLFTDY